MWRDRERVAAGLRNRLESPERLFCSESYARLLQLAAERCGPGSPEAVRLRIPEQVGR